MARKRRGRGEGGIAFREDKGLWYGTISLGFDGNGKRRRQTVYGATKKEVQDKLRRLQNNTAAGLTGQAETLTVGQWLTKWLAQVQPTVEPNTYRPYEQHVRLHITPVLGNLKLARLKRAQVVDFYPALAARGVSAALQRKVGTTLTIALNAAIDLELLAANPAARVKKPKAAKPEMHPFDPDETARFLTAAAEDRLAVLYRVALDSGARAGELLALLWPDIDFAGNFLSITKSLEDVAGVLRVKETKTKKSRRRVDLSPDTMVALAEHRKTMLAAGFIKSPVFCDTAGGYLRLPNLYRDSFAPILARAQLGPRRLYDLRHTMATLLLLADVPAKVVSERLGHSSITLTLDTYSHVLPTMQKRAAATMGQLLGRPSATSQASG